MASMTMVSKHLTYTDYLKSPEINLRYEIIDGEMIMAPSPTVEHQIISQNLFLVLNEYVRANRLGVVLFAPLDVIIRYKPLRTRQPDLLFISNERGGVEGGRALRKSIHLEVAPDLAVEVLSPNETQTYIENKLEDYRKIKVRECWLIRPESQTVDVIRLSKSKIETLGIFGIGQSVQSEIFSELRLQVEEIFK
jgi:Uma2 family endonuclease